MFFLSHSDRTAFTEGNPALASASIPSGHLDAHGIFRGQSSNSHQRCNCCPYPISVTRFAIIRGRSLSFDQVILDGFAKTRIDEPKRDR